MGVETEFERIKSSFLRLSRKRNKISLSWKFFGETYQGSGCLMPNLGIILTSCQDSKGGLHTFVLDKDTLATDITILQEENDD